jgi:hypothetical protein
MKLTPSVTFINVLRTAFALVDPESIRTQSSCQYHFTLLGSTSAKAVRRTLMKLTPVDENVWALSSCIWQSLEGAQTKGRKCVEKQVV